MTCHFPHSPGVYDSRKIIITANRGKVKIKGRKIMRKKSKRTIRTDMIAQKKTILFSVEELTKQHSVGSFFCICLEEQWQDTHLPFCQKDKMFQNVFQSLREAQAAFQFLWSPH